MQDFLKFAAARKWAVVISRHRFFAGTVALIAVFLIGTLAQQGHLAFLSGAGTDDTQPQVAAASVASSTRVDRSIRREAEPTGAVDINTADEFALMTLSGIGASKAEAIVKDREARGSFYAPEDIMRVKGIGASLYESIREDITVGAVGPRPAAPAEPAEDMVQSTSAPQEPQKPKVSVNGAVFISAVMPGVKGAATHEYIELRNPETHAVDLTGWSVKKRTSRGKLSTLVSSKYFEGKILAAGGTLLLANSGGYTGARAADILWPASYSIAAANNGLLLFKSDGTQADEAAWTEIPEGTSCARASGGVACTTQAP